MLAHSLRSKTTAVRNLSFFGGTAPRMIMILDGISMGKLGFSITGGLLWDIFGCWFVWSSHLDEAANALRLNYGE